MDEAGYLVAGRGLGTIEAALALGGLILLLAALLNWRTGGMEIVTLAGLALGLGLGAFIAGRLRSAEARTLPDYLRQRFGRYVSVPAALVAATASFLLLVASLTVAATLLAGYAGLDLSRAAMVAAGFAAVPAVIGGGRAIVAVAVALAVVLASAGPAGGGLDALPALSDFAALFGPRDVPTILAIALGAAALPHLLGVMLAVRAPRTTGRAASVAFVYVAAVVLTSAGLWSGSAFGAPDLSTDGLTAIASGLAVVAALGAALLGTGSLLFSIGTTLGFDLLTQAVPLMPVDRRVAFMRLAAAGTAILAALIVGAPAGAAAAARVADLAATAILVSAGCLAPLLLVAVFDRETTPRSAGVALAIGTGGTATTLLATDDLATRAAFVLIAAGAAMMAAYLAPRLAGAKARRNPGEGRVPARRTAASPRR
jgi:Na+(H+)/acetate symporter ActP